jgi:hypothetical protein
MSSLKSLSEAKDPSYERNRVGYEPRSMDPSASPRLAQDDSHWLEDANLGGIEFNAPTRQRANAPRLARVGVEKSLEGVAEDVASCGGADGY